MNLLQQSANKTFEEYCNLPFVSYEPASLKEWSTGWQIEYRVLNPDTRVLEKKRLRFEKIRKRIGNDVKARKHAKLYCNAINEKLETGWNPYTEGKNAKAFHKLTDAFKAFIKEKELDLKNGVFSQDSMRTYRSQTDMLSNWLSTINQDKVYVGSFTKELAQKYLDYVYMEKQLAPRTWNNYLKFMRTMWGWLIEKNYCSENIFLKIKPKQETEKERKIITAEWNTKIMEYFKTNIPAMELVCGLVYNSFMRPAEICRTQISDIQIAKNGIYLSGKKTKNKRARWCLLPPHLIELITKMNIDKYPSDFYLFSSGLVPGKTALCTRKLDKYWHKMREAIKMPKEIQLYSYRDTGITDLKKAGHANLFIASITGHLNSDEIETYTHEPSKNALQYVIEQSKRL